MQLEATSQWLAKTRAAGRAIVELEGARRVFDMEELVVKPIEKRISELENLKRIKTVIKDGVAEIMVEYKYSSNVNDKYQELVREVNSIRDQLPQDIYSLEIRKVTPTDVSVLQLGLVSENASEERLKFYAEKLKEKLEKIPSLKKVEFHGVPDQQVRIDLNTDKFAQLRIPLNYIIGSIQSEAANIPAGSIRAGSIQNQARCLKRGK
jgi:multidrug efflux pump subunit AcrB